MIRTVHVDAFDDRLKKDCRFTVSRNVEMENGRTSGEEVVGEKVLCSSTSQYCWKYTHKVEPEGGGKHIHELVWDCEGWRKRPRSERLDVGLYDLLGGAANGGVYRYLNIQDICGLARVSRRLHEDETRRETLQARFMFGFSPALPTKQVLDFLDTKSLADDDNSILLQIYCRDVQDNNDASVDELTDEEVEKLARKRTELRIKFPGVSALVSEMLL
jgi:hypothetical protein